MSIAWFIFVALVIVWSQSYIYAKWGLSKVQYTRSFSEHAVVEGENIEMVDEISNKKLLPVPWLRLESKLSEHLQFQNQKETDHNIAHGGFHRTLFSLLPYQKVRRRQYLTCTRRGHYHFEKVDLTTGDVFGFGETFKRVTAIAEIIVYPRIVPLDDIPLPSNSWLGDIVVRRWIIEDPFLTSGVRDYSYGDPLNSINWKATARTNRLQVAKKDFSADHYLMIYVDFNQTGDIWRPIADKDLVEKSLSYAASIAQHSISKGISTGFGCNSYIGRKTPETIRIQPENSRQQLTYILETLAKVEVDSNKSIDFFLKEDIDNNVEGVDILIITAIVTDAMKANIDKLEAMGNSIGILTLESDKVLKKIKQEVG